MRKTAHILCLILSLIIAVSLVSCSKEAEKVFHTEIYTTSAGDMTLTAAYIKGENGERFTDDELSEIFKPVADAFESTYIKYSSAETYKYLNAETDKILDCDPDILAFISEMFAYSDKTGGLYEAAAGAYSLSETPGEEAFPHIGKDKFIIDGTTVSKTDKLAKIDPSVYVFAGALGDASGVFADSEIVSGRISIGGAAVVFGSKPDGDAFTISIDGEGETKGYFRLTEGAVSRTDKDNSMKYPVPDNGDFSDVTVFSPDPFESVMLSRIIFNMTEEEMTEFYKSGEFTFEAVMTKKDGTVITTERAKNGIYIEETAEAADE